MADDRIARAIDDINWPQFSDRLKVFDFRVHRILTGLDLLASIFFELQRFYDHFVGLLMIFTLIGILIDVMLVQDVRSALQRRQSMVAGFTPVAKKVLEDTARVEILDNPEHFGDFDAVKLMVNMWQYFLGPRVGLSSTKIPSLLHTHSTLCLQHQRFPTTPLERWELTCIGSGCLTHDSDEYQAIADSLGVPIISPDSGSVYQIWRLLTALDLTIQPLLSHFFDERFSERCAVVLAATIGHRFKWGALSPTIPLVNRSSYVTAPILLSTK